MSLSKSQKDNVIKVIIDPQFKQEAVKDGVTKLVNDVKDKLEEQTGTRQFVRNVMKQQISDSLNGDNGNATGNYINAIKRMQEAQMEAKRDDTMPTMFQSMFEQSKRTMQSMFASYLRSASAITTKMNGSSLESTLKTMSQMSGLMEAQIARFQRITDAKNTYLRIRANVSNENIPQFDRIFSYAINDAVTQRAANVHSNRNRTLSQSGFYGYTDSNGKFHEGSFVQSQKGKQLVDMFSRISQRDARAAVLAAAAISQDRFTSQEYWNLAHQKSLYHTKGNKALYGIGHLGKRMGPSSFKEVVPQSFRVNFDEMDTTQSESYKKLGAEKIDQKQWDKILSRIGERQANGTIVVKQNKNNKTSAALIAGLRASGIGWYQRGGINLPNEAITKKQAAILKGFVHKGLQGSYETLDMYGDKVHLKDAMSKASVARKSNQDVTDVLLAQKILQSTLGKEIAPVLIHEKDRASIQAQNAKIKADAEAGVAAYYATPEKQRDPSKLPNRAVFLHNLKVRPNAYQTATITYKDYKDGVVLDPSFSAEKGTFGAQKDQSGYYSQQQSLMMDMLGIKQNKSTQHKVLRMNVGSYLIKRDKNGQYISNYNKKTGQQEFEDDPQAMNFVETAYDEHKPFTVKVKNEKGQVQEKQYIGSHAKHEFMYAIQKSQYERIDNLAKKYLQFGKQGKYADPFRGLTHADIGYNSLANQSKPFDAANKWNTQAVSLASLGMRLPNEAAVIDMNALIEYMTEDKEGLIPNEVKKMFHIGMRSEKDGKYATKNKQYDGAMYLVPTDKDGNRYASESFVLRGDALKGVGVVGDWKAAIKQAMGLDKFYFPALAAKKYKGGANDKYKTSADLLRAFTKGQISQSDIQGKYKDYFLDLFNYDLLMDESVLKTKFFTEEDMTDPETRILNNREINERIQNYANMAVAARDRVEGDVRGQGWQQAIYAQTMSSARVNSQHRLSGATANNFLLNKQQVQANKQKWLHHIEDLMDPIKARKILFPDKEAYHQYYDDISTMIGDANFREARSQAISKASANMISGALYAQDNAQMVTAAATVMPFAISAAAANGIDLSDQAKSKLSDEQWEILNVLSLMGQQKDKSKFNDMIAYTKWAGRQNTKNGQLGGFRYPLNFGQVFSLLQQKDFKKWAQKFNFDENLVYARFATLDKMGGGDFDADQVQLVRGQLARQALSIQQKVDMAKFRKQIEQQNPDDIVKLSKFSDGQLRRARGKQFAEFMKRTITGRFKLAKDFNYANNIFQTDLTDLGTDRATKYLKGAYDAAQAYNIDSTFLKTNVAAKVTQYMSQNGGLGQGFDRLMGNFVKKVSNDPQFESILDEQQKGKLDFSRFNAPSRFHLTTAAALASIADNPTIISKAGMDKIIKAQGLIQGWQRMGKMDQVRVFEETWANYMAGAILYGDVRMSDDQIQLLENMLAKAKNPGASKYATQPKIKSMEDRLIALKEFGYNKGIYNEGQEGYDTDATGFRKRFGFAGTSRVLTRKDLQQYSPEERVQAFLMSATSVLDQPGYLEAIARLVDGNIEEKVGAIQDIINYAEQKGISAETILPDLVTSELVFNNANNLSFSRLHDMMTGGIGDDGRATKSFRYLFRGEKKDGDHDFDTQKGHAMNAVNGIASQRQMRMRQAAYQKSKGKRATKYDNVKALTGDQAQAIFMAAMTGNVEQVKKFLTDDQFKQFFDGKDSVIDIFAKYPEFNVQRSFEQKYPNKKGGVTTFEEQMKSLRTTSRDVAQHAQKRHNLALQYGVKPKWGTKIGDDNTPIATVGYADMSYMDETDSTVYVSDQKAQKGKSIDGVLTKAAQPMTYALAYDTAFAKGNTIILPAPKTQNGHIDRNLMRPYQPYKINENNVGEGKIVYIDNDGQQHQGMPYAPDMRGANGKLIARKVGITSYQGSNNGYEQQSWSFDNATLKGLADEYKVEVDNIKAWAQAGFLSPTMKDAAIRYRFDPELLKLFKAKRDAYFHSDYNVPTIQYKINKRKQQIDEQNGQREQKNREEQPWLYPETEKPNQKEQKKQQKKEQKKEQQKPILTQENKKEQKKDEQKQPVKQSETKKDQPVKIDFGDEKDSSDSDNSSGNNSGSGSSNGSNNSSNNGSDNGQVDDEKKKSNDETGNNSGGGSDNNISILSDSGRGDIRRDLGAKGDDDLLSVRIAQANEAQKRLDEVKGKLQQAQGVFSKQEDKLNKENATDIQFENIERAIRYVTRDSLDGYSATGEIEKIKNQQQHNVGKSQIRVVESLRKNIEDKNIEDGVVAFVKNTKNQADELLNSSGSISSLGEMLQFEKRRKFLEDRITKFVAQHDFGTPQASYMRDVVKNSGLTDDLKSYLDNLKSDNFEQLKQQIVTGQSAQDSIDTGVISIDGNTRQNARRYKAMRAAAKFRNDTEKKRDQYLQDETLTDKQRSLLLSGLGINQGDQSVFNNNVDKYRRMILGQAYRDDVAHERSLNASQRSANRSIFGKSTTRNDFVENAKDTLMAQRNKYLKQMQDEGLFGSYQYEDFSTRSLKAINERAQAVGGTQWQKQINQAIGQNVNNITTFAQQYRQGKQLRDATAQRIRQIQTKQTASVDKNATLTPKQKMQREKLQKQKNVLEKDYAMNQREYIEKQKKILYGQKYDEANQKKKKINEDIQLLKQTGKHGTRTERYSNLKKQKQRLDKQYGMSKEQYIQKNQENEEYNKMLKQRYENGRNRLRRTREELKKFDKPVQRKPTKKQQQEYDQLKTTQKMLDNIYGGTEEQYIEKQNKHLEQLKMLEAADLNTRINQHTRTGMMARYLSAADSNLVQRRSDLTKAKRAIESMTPDQLNSAFGKRLISSTNKLEKQIDRQTNDDGTLNMRGLIKGSIKSIGSRMSYMALRAGINAVTTGIKQAISAIKEYETAMSGLQAATLKSDSQMSKLGQSITSMASQLRTSISQIANVVTELYNLNFSDTQVKDMTQSIYKYSSLTGTDTQGSAKFAKYMTQSGLTSNIDDAYNMLLSFGMDAAGQAGNIASVIQNAGSTAAKYGATDFQILSLLASAGVNGTSLTKNTGYMLTDLFGMLNDVKTKSTVQNAEGVSIASSAVKSVLSSVGINVDTSSIFDIISGIATQWQQNPQFASYIASMLFGSSQYASEFTSLMSGAGQNKGQRMNQYMGTSNDTDLINEKYAASVDNLTAKLQELSTTWQGVLNSFADSGVFDTVIGIMKNISSSSASVISAIVGITTAMAALLIVKSGLTGNWLGTAAVLGTIGVVGIGLATSGTLANNNKSYADENWNYFNDSLQNGKTYTTNINGSSDRLNQLFNSNNRTNNQTMQMYSLAKKINQDNALYGKEIDIPNIDISDLQNGLNNAASAAQAFAKSVISSSSEINTERQNKKIYQALGYAANYSNSLDTDGESIDEADSGLFGKRMLNVVSSHMNASLPKGIVDPVTSRVDLDNIDYTNDKDLNRLTNAGIIYSVYDDLMSLDEGSFNKVAGLYEVNPNNDRWKVVSSILDMMFFNNGNWNKNGSDWQFTTSPIKNLFKISGGSLLDKNGNNIFSDSMYDTILNSNYSLRNIPTQSTTQYGQTTTKNKNIIQNGIKNFLSWIIGSASYGTGYLDQSQGATNEFVATALAAYTGQHSSTTVDGFMEYVDGILNNMETLSTQQRNYARQWILNTATNDYDNGTFDSFDLITKAFGYSAGIKNGEWGNFSYSKNLLNNTGYNAASNTTSGTTGDSDSSESSSETVNPKSTASAFVGNITDDKLHYRGALKQFNSKVQSDFGTATALETMIGGIDNINKMLSDETYTDLITAYNAYQNNPTQQNLNRLRTISSIEYNKQYGGNTSLTSNQAQQYLDAMNASSDKKAWWEGLTDTERSLLGNVSDVFDDYADSGDTSYLTTIQTAIAQLNIAQQSAIDSNVKAFESQLKALADAVTQEQVTKAQYSFGTQYKSFNKAKDSLARIQDNTASVYDYDKVAQYTGLSADYLYTSGGQAAAQSIIDTKSGQYSELYSTASSELSSGRLAYIAQYGATEQERASAGQQLDYYRRIVDSYNSGNYDNSLKYAVSSGEYNKSLEENNAIDELISKMSGATHKTENDMSAVVDEIDAMNNSYRQILASNTQIVSIIAQVEAGTISWENALEDISRIRFDNLTAISEDRITDGINEIISQANSGLISANQYTTWSTQYSQASNILGDQILGYLLSKNEDIRKYGVSLAQGILASRSMSNNFLTDEYAKQLMGDFVSGLSTSRASNMSKQATVLSSRSNYAKAQAAFDRIKHGNGTPDDYDILDSIYGFDSRSVFGFAQAQQMHNLTGQAWASSKNNLIASAATLAGEDNNYIQHMLNFFPRITAGQTFHGVQITQDLYSMLSLLYNWDNLTYDTDATTLSNNADNVAFARDKSNAVNSAYISMLTDKDYDINAVMQAQDSMLFKAVANNETLSDAWTRYSLGNMNKTQFMRILAQEGGVYGAASNPLSNTRTAMSNLSMSGKTTSEILSAYKTLQETNPNALSNLKSMQEYINAIESGNMQKAAKAYANMQKEMSNLQFSELSYGNEQLQSMASNIQAIISGGKEATTVLGQMVSSMYQGQNAQAIASIMQSGGTLSETQIGDVTSVLGISRRVYDLNQTYWNEQYQQQIQNDTSQLATPLYAYLTQSEDIKLDENTGLFRAGKGNASPVWTIDGLMNYMSGNEQFMNYYNTLASAGYSVGFNGKTFTISYNGNAAYGQQNPFNNYTALTSGDDIRGIWDILSSGQDVNEFVETGVFGDKQYSLEAINQVLSYSGDEYNMMSFLNGEYGDMGTGRAKAAFEQLAQVIEQKAVTAQNKFSGSTTNVVSKMNAQYGSLKKNAEGFKSLREQMNQVLSNQYYRNKYKSGDRSAQTIEYIKSLGFTEAQAKSPQYADAINKAIDLDEILDQQKIQESLDSMDSSIAQKITAHHLQIPGFDVDISSGSINYNMDELLSTFGAYLNDFDLQFIELCKKAGIEAIATVSSDGKGGFMVDWSGVKLGSGGSSGGGGGGGGKSVADELLQKIKRMLTLDDHVLKMYQYQQQRYANEGQYANENAIISEINDLIVNRQLPNIAKSKQQIVQLMNKTEYHSDDWYSLAEEYQTLEEKESQLTNTIQQNTKKMKQNYQAIIKTRTALEDTVSQEVQTRLQEQRDLLAGTVQMQSTILDAIKARYQSEWELAKKDLQNKKSALQEEISMIDERLNARKNAADEADKYEQLAELRRQYAMISMDSTRTKDAAQMAKKIKDLEEELAWSAAQKDAETAKKTLQDESDTIDSITSEGDEYLQNLLEDANNFADEVNTVLGMSQEDLYSWLSANDKNYINSLQESQEQMLMSWQDTYAKMKGITYSYWDEATGKMVLATRDEYYAWMDELLGTEGVTNKQGFLEYMMQSSTYKNASDAQRKLLEIQWDEEYQDYISAHKTGATYQHDDDFLQGVGTVASTQSVVTGYRLVDENGNVGSDVYATKAQAQAAATQKSNAGRAMNTMHKLRQDVYGQQGVDWQLAPQKYTVKASYGNVTSYTSAKAYMNALGMNTSKYNDENKTNPTNDLSAYKSKKELSGAYSNVENSVSNMLTDSILQGQQDAPKYASGGLVNYTGPAWVDGTPSSPEAFLSARDTALLRDMLDAANYVKAYHMMNVNTSLFASSTPTIDTVSIVLNEAQFNTDDDYDLIAQKVGEAFTKELTKSGMSTVNYNF